MPHKIPPYVGYTEFYPTTTWYFKSDLTFKIKSVHDIMVIGLREMDKVPLTQSPNKGVQL